MFAAAAAAAAVLLLLVCPTESFAQAWIKKSPKLGTILQIPHKINRYGLWSWRRPVLHMRALAQRLLRGRRCGIRCVGKQKTCRSFTIT
jgi:hypothetical protein